MAMLRTLIEGKKSYDDPVEVKGGIDANGYLLMRFNDCNGVEVATCMFGPKEVDHILAGLQKAVALGESKGATKQ